MILELKHSGFLEIHEKINIRSVLVKCCASCTYKTMPNMAGGYDHEFYKPYYGCPAAEDYCVSWNDVCDRWCGDKDHNDLKAKIFSVENTRYREGAEAGDGATEPES